MHSPSTHVVPIEQSIPGTQRPMPSQFSIPVPFMLQRFVPGVQLTQMPPIQVEGDIHGVPSCHWPLLPQVCGVFGAVGLHCAGSPGVQAQHTPPVHPRVQVLVAPQCPSVPHAWLV